MSDYLGVQSDIFEHILPVDLDYTFCDGQLFGLDCFALDNNLDWIVFAMDN